MIEPVKHITAAKILEEYSTEGSHPLKIIGDDNRLYVVKFTENQPQRIEIINELICGLVAKAWGLHAPEMAIVKFTKEVVSQFNYSKRYKPHHFEEEFFGSCLIQPVIEVEEYIGEVTKSQYRKFESPLDLLAIGCFDYWIGNADRKPSNPNLLISEDKDGKLVWHPIDHTAAFAYQKYNNLRDSMVRVGNNIMGCKFVKSICKFEERKNLEKYHKNVHLRIKNALPVLDDILNQVPPSWQFGRKSKERIKIFFESEDRNQRIARSYIGHLK